MKPEQKKTIHRGALFFLACLIIPFATVLSLHATWIPQNSGVTADLNSVFFIDTSTGWAVGASGTILKTSDGGSTWSPQNSGVASILRDVKFINGSTGVVVGNGGVILKTINGGTTWFAVTSGINTILYSVAWGDTTTLYACGQLGLIRKSTDAGNTWADGAPNGTGNVNDLKSIFFINPSTGWTVGNSATLLITYNGGNNWFGPNGGFGSSGNRQSIFFISVSTGWSAGSGGFVHKSTDSGLTWTATFSTNTGLNSVHFISSTTGRIVGDGGFIFKSTDSGLNFIPESSTNTNSLSKVFMLGNDAAVTVGSSGTILLNTTPAAVVVVPPPTQGAMKAINNLFDPSKGEVTTIRYDLFAAGYVTIKIYSMQGQLIKTLVSGARDPGSFTVTWDGKNEDGQTVATGIYLVHIEGPGFSKNQKIAVVQ